MSIKA